VEIERTFTFLKPDSVMRGLIGEIVSRFEKKGLNIVGAKLITVSAQQAEKLYEVHKGKPFYGMLISHVTSGPIFAMIVEGPNAVTVVRKLVGATNPQEAGAGTIRGDYAVSITPNAIHASDSVENAKGEMAIFFEYKDIVSYKRPAEEKYLWKE
jgi:nucleoside-diphosphate kinase